MNLGQFITSYSPLPSATVADHLLALQIGTGGGQTIFAKFMDVTLETMKVVALPVKETRFSVLQESHDKSKTEMYSRITANQSFSTSRSELIS